MRIVPALTFGVSTNFALANFLASRSFGNVSVALACVRFPGPRSNETYHVPLDLSAIMRRSRGNSIKGERDSFPAIQSCHLPALWIRFPWRPVFSDSLPSQNAPAALLESAVGHHLLISGPHSAGQYLRRALSACFLDFGHYRCRVDFRLRLFAR